MKITKKQLKQIIKEELNEVMSAGEEMKARIRKDQEKRGHVASPTGTPSGDDWTLRTQAIHNLLGKRLHSDMERAEALRDLADELEESHHDRAADFALEEGHYNKDPRPCADDERYQPPNRNDYRQFGKCVKKEKRLEEADSTSIKKQLRDLEWKPNKTEADYLRISKLEKELDAKLGKRKRSSGISYNPYDYEE
jgi:hypothetical protein